MKPYIHAQSSVKKFGGKPEDYLKIHNWFDQTKSHFSDVRHRAILHTSFGIFLCEQVFGTNITNSDGKKVSVRDIGEQHVVEDYRGKFIPTMQDFLENMEFQDWMDNGNGYPRSCDKIHPKKTEKSAQETLAETFTKLPPSEPLTDDVIFPKRPASLHSRIYD